MRRGFVENFEDPGIDTEEKKRSRQSPLARLSDEKMRELYKKLSKQRDRFTIDAEDCRIDFGVVIDRNPIFLYTTEPEMKWMKYRFENGKKYKYIAPHLKELMDFKPHTPVDGFFKQNQDNMATHRLRHDDGTSTTFSANSMHYTLADPDTKDHHSIQYAGANRCYFIVKDKNTGKWLFPTDPLGDNMKLSDGQALLFNKISKNKWDIIYDKPLPVVFEKRDLTETERKDPKNRRAKAVKTFYLPAKYYHGAVSVNSEYYSDYAWVTKGDLNKFFDKPTYEQFIFALSEF